MEKAKLILVTGGSRSGKSRYALERLKGAKHPLFVATGWAGDAEMAERIARHQAERGKEWDTVETRTQLAKALQSVSNHDAVLIDCLTLWVSNLMFEENLADSDTVLERTDEVISVARMLKIPVFFVTNEVGCGIVPEHETARRFRDWAGWVNQRVAMAADEVILCVSGIPVRIK